MFQGNCSGFVGFDILFEKLKLELENASLAVVLLPRIQKLKEAIKDPDNRMNFLVDCDNFGGPRAILGF